MSRETLIVYGDCQAYAVIRVLASIRTVAERFDLKFHPLADSKTNWQLWSKEIMSASFMFLQSISLDTYPFQYISRDLRPTTVLFPPVSFPSLWPFSVEFAGEDQIAEQLYESRTPEAGIHYFDVLLGLLRDIPNKNERFEAYRRLQHGGMPAVAKFLKLRNIRRIHELDCLRLKKLDTKFELSIGEYIIENFRQLRLFHTVRHPAVGLVYVLVRQLLSKLNLCCELSRPLLDSLSYYQIPVHPIVAKTLKVSWAKEDLSYAVHKEDMTFERYVRRYIDEFG